jgi:hypothetical protein
LAFHSRREADHSPPSSAEVKEWVELYLHSPIRIHGVVLRGNTGGQLLFIIKLSGKKFETLCELKTSLLMSIKVKNPREYLYLYLYLSISFIYFTCRYCFNSDVEKKNRMEQTYLIS